MGAYRSLPTGTDLLNAHLGVQAALAPYSIPFASASNPTNGDAQPGIMLALADAYNKSDYGGVVALPEGSVTIKKPLVFGDYGSLEGTETGKTTLDCYLAGGPMVHIGSYSAWPTASPLVTGEDLSVVMPGEDPSNVRSMELSFGGFRIDTNWSQFSLQGYWQPDAAPAGNPHYMVFCGGRRVSAHSLETCFSLALDTLSRIVFKLRIGTTLYTVNSPAITLSPTNVYYIAAEYVGAGTIRLWVTLAGTSTGAATTAAVTDGVVRMKMYEQCFIGYPINNSYYSDTYWAHPIAGRMGSMIIGNVALKGTVPFTAPNSTLVNQASTKVAFKPDTANQYLFFYKILISGLDAYVPRRGNGSIGGGGAQIKNIIFRGFGAGLTAIFGVNCIRGRFSNFRVFASGGVWLTDLSYGCHIENYIYARCDERPCLAFSHSGLVTWDGAHYFNYGKSYAFIFNDSNVIQNGNSYLNSPEGGDCLGILNDMTDCHFQNLVTSDEGSANPGTYCGILMQPVGASASRATSSFCGIFELNHNQKIQFIIVPNGLDVAQIITLNGRSSVSAGTEVHVKYEGTDANIAKLPPAVVVGGFIFTGGSPAVPLTNKPGKIITQTPLVAVPNNGLTGDMSVTPIFNAAPVVGTYEVYGTILVTTPATTGTMHVTCGWTDSVGAVFESTGEFDMTAGGQRRFNFRFLFTTSGTANVTLSTTFTSLTGSPVYNLSYAAKNQQIAA